MVDNTEIKHSTIFPLLFHRPIFGFVRLGLLFPVQSAAQRHPGDHLFPLQRRQVVAHIVQHFTDTIQQVQFFIGFHF